MGMRTKKVKLTAQQQEELNNLARHSPMAHIRIKALAVYNVGQGMPEYKVAEAFHMERRTVGRWVRNYLSQGVNSFAISPGRGRRPRVKAEEIEYHLRQAPTHFGISRTRWTLAMLAQVVPGFRGMSEVGIWKALRRLGFRYKRGQPSIHSPDPQYWEKRGL